MHECNSFGHRSFFLENRFPGGIPRMFRVLTRALAIAVLVLPLAGRAALAEGSPVQIVQDFYAVLLDVMKNADKLGFDGRKQKLAPVIDKTFDLPLMTRLSIGPQWKDVSPEDQKKLEQAFRDMTIATYAGRFDGYSGEKFEVSPEPAEANGGKVVQTKLVQGNGEPIQLNYLMRDNGQGWHAIDVFLKGTVSELATRRSEYTSVLRRDGAGGLLKLMSQKAAEAKG
jgi:phospholipid transport system substrate-binding protein